MSIVRVNKDDIENFTIVTTPRREYSSSSLGTTGSIKLLPRLSRAEKDMSAAVDVDSQGYLDGSFLELYNQVLDKCDTKRLNGLEPITDELETYLKEVNDVSSKTDYRVEIERFTPSITTTKYTGAKNLIKEMLMKHYRSDYPHAHWAYTNYHTLNFFTINSGSQTVPTSSVLLYPNDDSLSNSMPSGTSKGNYCLSGAFSFDFRINMRYQEDGIDSGHFKAGTLFHLSSSYALSIVTGSSKDAKGLPNGFRLLLQLTQSADILPSKAVQGAYPSDLVFLSNDNVLEHNKWHHVVVRWGTNSLNQGTGSFVVDGVNAGYFAVPSGTINPIELSPVVEPPTALAVGNYYEGTNSGTSKQDIFFTVNASEAYGTQIVNQSSNAYNPAAYRFSHPLKAEVHNLCIKRYYVSDDEIRLSGSTGPGVLAQDTDKFAFHLPPMFTQASPIRVAKANGTIGGVYQTPYKSISSTTDDPFNVAMSFIANGHYINLENYTRDFTYSLYPRLIDLSGSIQTAPGPGVINANNILYGYLGVAKRNLTILPCDDGNFDPNYELLKQETLNDKYVNSLQVYDQGKNKIFPVRDWSYINLDNLVSTASLYDTKGEPDSSFYSQNLSSLYGPSPLDVGQEPSGKLAEFYSKLEANIQTFDESFDRGILSDYPLPVYQKLRDPSSNQITIFDISNLFYGKRILPQSFILTDANITGSSGRVKITIKDDGDGNLYRADARTPHATQNSIGNIFYDEGLIVIKSPHLYFFGKEQYEISFKGINNIYTTKYEILAGSGLLNSSSNPTYAANKDALMPTGDITDKEGFVYISTINLHDENMNVLARAKLAQPVIKRFSDKILFKFTLDS